MDPCTTSTVESCIPVAIELPRKPWTHVPVLHIDNGLSSGSCIIYHRWAVITPNGWIGRYKMLQYTT